MIKLVAVIKAKLEHNSLAQLIIQAYVDKNGDYLKICEAYSIPKSTYYDCLNNHIKKLFMDFYLRKSKRFR